MIEVSTLEKIVDFYLFQQPTAEETTKWINKMSTAGVNPQVLADIVVESIEEIPESPNEFSIEVCNRLRSGEMNQYIASRLGYV